MAREAVAFLAGSPDRQPLLDHLADEPAAPRDIADELDVSTRSAQRNLSEFEDRGWATKREGCYHLTTAGHLVRETYAACLDRLDALAETSVLYEHLPGPEDAPDPTWLTDATYVAAEDDHPQAPVTHYVDALESLETDNVRMLAPVLSRIFHEPHAKLVMDGASTELVMPTDKVDAAREKNPREFEGVVAVPRFSLYRYDGDVEYGLTVTDDRTFVLAYGGDGQLRACVESADPDLRSWAVDRFESYRDAATEVEGNGPF